MTTSSLPRYVAIGSSFAAGPGINPATSDRSPKSRQSARNYPHLVAADNGFELVDVTSSGATVDHVLHTSQFGQPPQIDAVTKQAAVVTVTVGGNDIGYVANLIVSCLPSWTQKVPLLRQRLRGAIEPSHVADRTVRTRDRVGSVFAAIRDRAPEAHVLCIDYLTVLPPTFIDALPMSEPAYDMLVLLAHDLDSALAQAATEHGVDLIPASAHSVRHHAWSNQPWTTGWTGLRSRPAPAFHPTIDGMLAVAEQVKHNL